MQLEELPVDVSTLSVSGRLLFQITEALLLFTVLVVFS